jgi:hypothetical protein
MSAHLIQPIDVHGIPLCPIYQSGRMTTGVVTESFVTPSLAVLDAPQSPWRLVILPSGDLAGDGEVSFGVACGSTVTLDFTSSDTSTSPDYYIEIYAVVDGEAFPSVGVPLTTLTSAGAGDSISGLEIDLSDAACGNVVVLICSASRTGGGGTDDGTLTVTAQVASIS